MINADANVFFGALSRGRTGPDHTANCHRQFPQRIERGKIRTICQIVTDSQFWAICSTCATSSYVSLNTLEDRPVVCVDHERSNPSSVLTMVLYRRLPGKRMSRLFARMFTCVFACTRQGGNCLTTFTFPPYVSARLPF